MDQPLLPEERLVNSVLASFSLFITGTTSFTICGYLWSCMSPIVLDLKLAFNKTYTDRYGTPLPEYTWHDVLLPLMMSSDLLGGIVGGFSSKYLLRICSRNQLLQLAHSIITGSVLVLALIGGLTLSYEAIIVGRFLAGISTGLFYSIVPSILAEMSTWHQQGFYQSVTAISLAFGCLCGPIIAHPRVLGSYQLWPYMISITVLPSIVYLISSIWIPNSPYYVYRKKGRECALVVLAKLRKGSQSSINDQLKAEMKMMEAEMKQGEAIELLEMLTTKQYRNQLVTLLVISLNYVLTGIDNMLLYTNLVFIQAGLQPEYASFATIGVYALPCVMVFFASKFVDIFGARKVNITSGILMVISYTLYTISQATLHLYPSVMPYMAIAGIGMLIVVWFGGVNPATFVLLGELTLERTRATAFSCSSIAIYLGAFVVGFVPPYLQEYLGTYSMTPWLGFAIVFVIYQIVYLPETKGRSSEEIQLKFK